MTQYLALVMAAAAAAKVSHWLQGAQGGLGIEVVKACRSSAVSSLPGDLYNRR